MKRISLRLHIAFPVLMILVSSCISFNTTGFKTLSKEQRERVAIPKVPLDQLKANDTIYTVNDSMVKDWLADKEYAIVHSFLTWCKGEYCIPPSIALKNLQENPLPFLMIAGDFESKNGFRTNYPFMCIDFDYYKTKSYSTGIEKMYRALGCGETWWELYSLFNNGQFVGSAQTLDDLLKLFEEAYEGEKNGR